MSKVLYSTTITSNNGRDGRVFSPDNTFVQNLGTPKELGGNASTEVTNPEQLFAAGYSACFNSALSLILQKNNVKDVKTSVEATVHLLSDPTDDGFKISVDLLVNFENLSQEDGEIYANKAHDFCPYSKATRGNIIVNITVEAE